MIPDSLPHITDRIRLDIPREQLIVGQHDALDVFMFFRRNSPEFHAEQARNRAKMPRCVTHKDRVAPVYEGKKTPLCADCYVALVKARQMKNSYMVTGTVTISVEGQETRPFIQTEVQAGDEDEACAVALGLILETARDRDRYASVKFTEPPIVREVPTLRWEGNSRHQ
jgi:hypothetical protein